MKRFQRVNHFPAMMGITKKSQLAQLLKKMKDMYPQDFNFFPKSWNVPTQLQRLKTDMAEAKRKQKTPNDRAMYIVKPSDMAQGKGIFFATEYEQVVKALHIENGKMPMPVQQSAKKQA